MLNHQEHHIAATGSGPVTAGASEDRPLHPTTPDGRYFVVRGRLWRRSNPELTEEVRDALVGQLMDARRDLRGSPPEAERVKARTRIDQAKRSLGERGPVWWTDGAPDFNRRLVKNTPYQQWFGELPGRAAETDGAHRPRR